MPDSDADTDWQPTRWWRVNDPDGLIWCETSNEEEARKALRPGDTLHRLFTSTEGKWVPQDLPPDSTRGGDPGKDSLLDDPPDPTRGLDPESRHR